MKRRIIKYSILRIAFLTITLLILFNTYVKAQYNENTIKAAYIERITRFVEWPGNNDAFPDNRFVIGVYGEADFYKTLTDVFKETLIKDHKVYVTIIKRPEQINTCNLCYISEKAEPLVISFVKNAKAFGVLLISGTQGFAQKGVHINFYIEDEKLKFEINKASIDSAGFKVSYLLLQNTRIIQ